VLLLAKFVAGSISALLLFGSAILADFALMYADSAQRDMITSSTALALASWRLISQSSFWPVLGYGAVFLLLSMMFKNPTPAAMLVLGWEAINPCAAFLASEDQRRVLSAPSDAGQRCRGRDFRTADGTD
jgi:hypothetical protein